MADESAGGKVGQGRGALARARRAALAALALALSAYGYGPEPDPFIDAWKQVAANANQGRWAEASSAGRALEPGLQELDTGLGLKLREEIASSLAARDARRLARELTSAACGAVLWKLESSRRSGLDDYYATKYRVEAARNAYLELLAPVVRQRDHARGTRAHERVLKALDAAQDALGRPGFLGRGVRPADAGAFAAAERELDGALRSVFPFAPEVTR